MDVGHEEKSLKTGFRVATGNREPHERLNLISYIYGKPKQKILSATNVLSSIDSSDNKRFHFREFSNFKFPEVMLNFPGNETPTA